MKRIKATSLRIFRCMYNLDAVAEEDKGDVTTEESGPESYDSDWD